jgi:hypothetical protein
MRDERGAIASREMRDHFAGFLLIIARSRAETLGFLHDGRVVAALGVICSSVVPVQ